MSEPTSTTRREWWRARKAAIRAHARRVAAEEPLIDAEIKRQRQEARKQAEKKRQQRAYLKSKKS
jgi:hypothetical protein